MALYNWTDGELVTAAKLNDYGSGMEDLKTASEAAKTAAETAQTAAENANTSAQSAKTDAESAKTSAESAQAKAESARSAAVTAQGKAEAAQTAAESANTSAQSAKTAAESAKSAAVTAQGKAETANTSAQSANTSAQSAKTAAETAKTGAETAQAAAEDAVAHNPTIKSGVWYVWSPDKGDYVTTDVPATGELTVTITYQQGDTSTTPPTGTWQSTPPDVAQGKYLWTKNDYSDGATGYTVARQGVDGEGAVVSVNGMSGVVKLTYSDVNALSDATTATDIGALPDTTKIPSKTSDLTNDSNFAVDASYVHTDNNYTSAEKTKLSGIATSATANTILNLSGTLTTSWTGSAAPYSQAVTLSGILATDTPILDLICSTSNYEPEQEAWGKVFKAVCSANTITFYASEASETSVSFNAKVVR